MKYLAYYKEEERHFKDFLVDHLSPNEAVGALCALSEAFDTPIKEIRFRPSAGWSSASHDGSITIAGDMMNWLTLAHEFAHLVHFRHHKWGRGFPDYARCHDGLHALITCFVIEWLRSEGWAK